MAAPRQKSTRLRLRKCLLVLLIFSATTARLVSADDNHDSSAFYQGMEELLKSEDTREQPQTGSVQSSVELDRMQDSFAVEPERTGREQKQADFLQSSAELDRTQESLAVEPEKTGEEKKTEYLKSQSSAEVDRALDSSAVKPDSIEDSITTSSSTKSDETERNSVAVESKEPLRSAVELDRMGGNSIEKQTQEASRATDRTLLEKDVESNRISNPAATEADRTEGSTVAKLDPEETQISSNVESEGTTASSTEDSGKTSTSVSVKLEEVETLQPVSGETVKKESENASGDSEKSVNQTLHDLVAPDNNTTAANGTKDVPDDDEDMMSSKRSPKKVSCKPRELDAGETPVVKIVNATELIQVLKITQTAPGNVTSEGDCVLIMFYAPWCPFSAAAAPPFHALARAFPSIQVLAIDAIKNSHLNTRFGTVAVPNIMLFYNGKALSRFNQSERSLEQLSMFVKNHTGLEGDASVEVLPEDYAGPLPTTPSDDPDYFLWASWAFIVTFTGVALLRSSPGKRCLVWLGVLVPVQHQHAD